MSLRGFKAEELEKEEILKLKDLGRLARGDILKMTTLAESGHPGGSMSSIDIYLVLYSYANVNPRDSLYADRDRIVISHGHTSPGVYAALARTGFFDIDRVIATFRKAKSIFEGHVERCVPGVEWSTGNLGQGLSAGCGFSLGGRIHHRNYHTFVVMGDGEQTKGQVSEARRFAKKYKLNNLTVIVDYNRFQLSGPLKEIMPQNIKENYISDGWKVLEIDGHNYQAIYQAIRSSIKDETTPVAIIARTTMGKGVSFMEDEFEFHGKPLSREQCHKALKELGLNDDLDKYEDLREKISLIQPQKDYLPEEKIDIDTGTPFTYKEERMDNRTAFGKTLENLAKINVGKQGKTPIVAFDCDLAGSVRTNRFANICPDYFFQGGIQEHNTATIAGVLSIQGILTFFADFGVFGVDETFNQQRLNDINQTNLKLVCTHNGLDIGQDGKTHQCIDYVGVIRNLYSYKIIIPADPNQTDRIIRYIATQRGNFFVVMGRAKNPVILTEDGRPFFGEDYRFSYGKADLLREGEEATIISMGSMVYKAVQAWQVLKEKGFSVRILNFSCLSDLDIQAVREASQTGVIITYEDHNLNTGLGSIIANVIAENRFNPRFHKMGVTEYGASGKSEELYKMQGLDVDTLVKVVIEEINLKRRID